MVRRRQTAKARIAKLSGDLSFVFVGCVYQAAVWSSVVALFGVSSAKVQDRSSHQESMLVLLMG